MEDTLLRLAVVGLAAGAIAWLLLSVRYVFWVRVRDGVPAVGRGKVARPFLQDIADVCSEHQVASGWVGGVRRGRRVSLAFSKDIPEACRQRLRNLWNVHGWK
jgi:hypothetical protein